MKDLIAKLQLDASCALGAIWMHIDAQAKRIAELEMQIAAPAADTDNLREAILALPCLGTMSQFEKLDDLMLYQQGHEDALHEAAESVASTAGQAPVREVPGWQPIETAPKDGTDILICQAWDASGNPMCETSHALFTQRAAWWSKENGGDGGWIIYNSMVLDPECFFEPTHWMPVPPIVVAAAPVQTEPKP